MNIDGEKPGARRYHVLALVSEDEHARVQLLAKRRGLTTSGLVRRAINYLLLDEGDDTEPIVERHPRGGRRNAPHEA